MVTIAEASVPGCVIPEPSPFQGTNQGRGQSQCCPGATPQRRAGLWGQCPIVAIATVYRVAGAVRFALA